MLFLVIREAFNWGEKRYWGVRSFTFVPLFLNVLCMMPVHGSAYFLASNPKLAPISRHVSHSLDRRLMISPGCSTFLYFLAIANASCRSFYSATGGVFFLLSAILRTVQAAWWVFILKTISERSLLTLREQRL